MTNRHNTKPDFFEKPGFVSSYPTSVIHDQWQMRHRALPSIFPTH